MRRIALTVIFLLCALSCGGTAAKVAYRNFDSFILYELDDLFALSQSQKAAASEIAAGAMRWHRSEVLPGYIPLLERARSAIQTGIGEKEYAALSDLTAAESRRIAEYIAPRAAEFALTLTDAQLDRFIIRCGGFNRKAEDRIREKRGDSGAYRVDQMMKTLEHFYGSFSGAQRTQINAIILSNDDIEHPELYLRYLQETQRGFAASVRTKDRTIVREYLRGWICRDPSFLPLYYRADLERAAAVRARIIAEVDRTVVRPENRRAGAAVFQEYIDAVRDLSIR